MFLLIHICTSNTHQATLGLEFNLSARVLHLHDVKRSQLTNMKAPLALPTPPLPRQQQQPVLYL